MKKNLFIALLLLIPFCSFSQTKKPIDGVLGIKFGSTKIAAAAAIKARGGKAEKASEADILVFNTISLGHRRAEMLILRFVDNKLFQADFIFKPQDDNHVIEYYDGLVSDINDNYGKGQSNKKYNSDYSANDKNQINDLRVGGAEYSTIWQTNVANNSNTVGASIVIDGDDLDVQLSYQNGELFDKALAKQKAKEKGDL